MYLYTKLSFTLSSRSYKGNVTCFLISHVCVSVGPEYVETTIAGKTRTWLSDRYFIGGFDGPGDPNQVIANTNHPQIYRTERYGAFQYEIPLPVGNYEIILHFAET